MECWCPNQPTQPNLIFWLGTSDPMRSVRPSMRFEVPTNQPNQVAITIPGWVGWLGRPRGEVVRPLPGHLPGMLVPQPTNPTKFDLLVGVVGMLVPQPTNPTKFDLLVGLVGWGGHVVRHLGGQASPWDPGAPTNQPNQVGSPGWVGWDAGAPTNQPNQVGVPKI